MRNECRICGSESFDIFLEFEQAPRSIERLLTRHELGNDKSCSLMVWRCKGCFHVQTRSDLEDTYYDDYYISDVASSFAIDSMNAQAREFVERFDLAGKKILEVGCGDGLFALTLKQYGVEVSAIEPSGKTLAVAHSRGIEPFVGYLDEASFPELTGQFDGLIARQVLEHVPDPNSFLRGARRMLKPGGCIQIDVPSLEKAMQDLRFFDFFPDHLSYFSETTLTHLFARNHFDVVDVASIFGGNWIQVSALCRPAPEGDAIQGMASGFRAAFDDFMAKERAARRRVAVWGAGGKGVMVLAMLDRSAIAYVVDGGAVKQGRFLPVSHLEVSPPARIASDPVDTVVITALSFIDEIVLSLRQNLGFKGKIAALVGGKVSCVSEDQCGPDGRT